MSRRWRVANMARGAVVALFAMHAPVAFADAVPVFSPTGPDAAAYGGDERYPVGPFASNVAQKYLVGHYSHLDSLTHFQTVHAPVMSSPLNRAPQEIAPVYSFQGQRFTIQQYLDRNPVTGLLIAKEDTILFEHYQYARTDRDRFLSQSMAKTITSMLVGIAMAEGAIKSMDDPAADYVSELAGTEYGKTSLRDLLHMSSGIAFREVYDGNDDVARFTRALFVPPGVPPAQAVAMFNTRDAPAGTRFHYASIETEILGLAVANAVGMPLSKYVEARIWQPMGAEANATWTTDATGHETAFCCFNSTLRDWARLGLVLAHDGTWTGKQIIPASWIKQATSVAAPYLAPRSATQFFGYGAQVWLFPGDRGQFALLGIHGQAIFVDPASRLVLVHTAVRLKATGDPGSAELVALWQAAVQQYGR